jgi:hypothetical protein
VGLLQLPDSSAAAGVITLTDGGYTFENVKPGDYLIKVSFVSYAADGKNVRLEQGQNEVIVDTIFLSETTTSLDEVTVVAERLKGKELVDRTVYAIPPVMAKASGKCGFPEQYYPERQQQFYYTGRRQAARQGIPCQASPFRYREYRGHKQSFCKI